MPSATLLNDTEALGGMLVTCVPCEHTAPIGVDQPPDNTPDLVTAQDSR